HARGKPIGPRQFELRVLLEVLRGELRKRHPGDLLCRDAASAGIKRARSHGRLEIIERRNRLPLCRNFVARPLRQADPCPGTARNLVRPIPGICTPIALPSSMGAAFVNRHHSLSIIIAKSPSHRRASLCTGGRARAACGPPPTVRTKYSTD